MSWGSTTSAARRSACRSPGAPPRRPRSQRRARPHTRPPAADGQVRAPGGRRARRAGRLRGRPARMARRLPRGAPRGRPVGGARPDHPARRAVVDHGRQARRPPAISLTWQQVRARRLARSALTRRSSSLVDVARQVAGIHAQVQASAELQLAARVDGVTQQDVRAALWRDRTLVKAWTLRGTLHLHPADELAVWFAANRAVARAPQALPAWPDPNGVVHPPVSVAERAKLQAATWEALGGGPLLREQVADEVVRRAGKKHEGRLRSGFAFFLTETCQGPPQGNKITLVRPDRWIQGWRDVDEHEALREVLRRFLYAYGPSRPQEFRAGFGTDVPFDLVDVEQVDVEGHSAFVLAGDTDFPNAEKSVRLLPEYDVYAMGFRQREQRVPARARARAAAPAGPGAARGRGRDEGRAGVRFLMVGGVAAGLWERKKRAREVEIAVSPATRFNRKALTAEVARFATFLGVEPALTVG